MKLPLFSLCLVAVCGVVLAENGFTAEFFRSADAHSKSYEQRFMTKVFERTDADINYVNWDYIDEQNTNTFQAKYNMPAGFPTDLFAVRWKGDISITNAGDYDFMAVADDGIRVYVDNVRIIDSWDLRARTPDARHPGIVNLSAGTHSIVVEYFEYYHRAHCELYWKRREDSTFSHLGGSDVTTPTEATISNYVVWTDYRYATVDDIAIESTSSSCQSSAIVPPAGWEVSPYSDDVARMAATYPFGTECLVTSDGRATATNLKLEPSGNAFKEIATVSATGSYGATIEFTSSETTGGKTTFNYRVTAPIGQALTHFSINVDNECTPDGFTASYDATTSVHGFVSTSNGYGTIPAGTSQEISFSVSGTVPTENRSYAVVGESNQAIGSGVVSGPQCATAGTVLAEATWTRRLPVGDSVCATSGALTGDGAAGYGTSGVCGRVLLRKAKVDGDVAKGVSAASGDSIVFAGREFSTLDSVSNADTQFCQTEVLDMPSGWSIAPCDDTTFAAFAGSGGNTFGTHCLICGSGGDSLSTMGDPSTSCGLNLRASYPIGRSNPSTFAVKPMACSGRVLIYRTTASSDSWESSIAEYTNIITAGSESEDVYATLDNAVAMDVNDQCQTRPIKMPTGWSLADFDTDAVLPNVIRGYPFGTQCIVTKNGKAVQHDLSPCETSSNAQYLGTHYLASGETYHFVRRCNARILIKKDREEEATEGTGVSNWSLKKLRRRCGRCSNWGSHYTSTFDNFRYRYHAIGEMLMAAPISVPNPLPEGAEAGWYNWRVTAHKHEFEKQGKRKFSRVLNKAIGIEYDGIKFLCEATLTGRKNFPKLYMDGIELNLDQNQSITDVAGKGITIKRLGKNKRGGKRRFRYKIKTPSGLNFVCKTTVVRWGKYNGVNLAIRLPNYFRENTQGLCGLCNKNKKDDIDPNEQTLALARPEMSTMSVDEPAVMKEMTFKHVPEAYTAEHRTMATTCKYSQDTWMIESNCLTSDTCPTTVGSECESDGDAMTDCEDISAAINACSGWTQASEANDCITSYCASGVYESQLSSETSEVRDPSLLTCANITAPVITEFVTAPAEQGGRTYALIDNSPIDGAETKFEASLIKIPDGWQLAANDPINRAFLGCHTWSSKCMALVQYNLGSDFDMSAEVFDHNLRPCTNIVFAEVIDDTDTTDAESCYTVTSTQPYTRLLLVKDPELSKKDVINNSDFSVSAVDPIDGVTRLGSFGKFGTKGYSADSATLPETADGSESAFSAKVDCSAGDCNGEDGGGVYQFIDLSSHNDIIKTYGISAADDGNDLSGKFEGFSVSTIAHGQAFGYVLDNPPTDWQFGITVDMIFELGGTFYKAEGLHKGFPLETLILSKTQSKWESRSLDINPYVVGRHVARVGYLTTTVDPSVATEGDWTQQTGLIPEAAELSRVHCFLKFTGITGIAYFHGLHIGPITGHYANLVNDYNFDRFMMLQRDGAIIDLQTENNYWQDCRVPNDGNIRWKGGDHTFPLGVPQGGYSYYLEENGFSIDGLTRPGSGSSASLKLTKTSSDTRGACVLQPIILKQTAKKWGALYMSTTHRNDANIGVAGAMGSHHSMYADIFYEENASAPKWDSSNSQYGEFVMLRSGQTQSWETQDRVFLLNNPNDKGIDHIRLHYLLDSEGSSLVDGAFILPSCTGGASSTHGVLFGDPHAISHDGLMFESQMVGEYTAHEDEFVSVQGRMDIAGDATVLTAVAIRHTRSGDVIQITRPNSVNISDPDYFQKMNDIEVVYNSDGGAKQVSFNAGMAYDLKSNNTIYGKISRTGMFENPTEVNQTLYDNGNTGAMVSFIINIETDLQEINPEDSLADGEVKKIGHEFIITIHQAVGQTYLQLYCSLPDYVFDFSHGILGSKDNDPLNDLRPAGDLTPLDLSPMPSLHDLFLDQTWRSQADVVQQTWSVDVRDRLFMDATTTVPVPPDGWVPKTLDNCSPAEQELARTSCQAYENAPYAMYVCMTDLLLTTSTNCNENLAGAKRSSLRVMSASNNNVDLNNEFVIGISHAMTLAGGNALGVSSISDPESTDTSSDDSTSNPIIDPVAGDVSGSAFIIASATIALLFAVICSCTVGLCAFTGAGAVFARYMYKVLGTEQAQKKDLGSNPIDFSTFTRLRTSSVLEYHDDIENVAVSTMTEAAAKSLAAVMVSEKAEDAPSQHSDDDVDLLNMVGKQSSIPSSPVTRRSNSFMDDRDYRRPSTVDREHTQSLNSSQERRPSQLTRQATADAAVWQRHREERGSGSDSEESHHSLTELGRAMTNTSQVDISTDRKPVPERNATGGI